MTTLGSRIKEERISHKLTQTELGKICGVTKYTISLYENDKSTPSDDIKKILADYFDVSVDYLLGITNTKKYNTVSLSKNDEKDIQKTLSKTLEQLENSQEGLMFDGEPIDEETRELLKISLESSIRLAKQIAKKKYTLKRYRK